MGRTYLPTVRLVAAARPGWIAGVAGAGVALGAAGRLSDYATSAPRLVFVLGAPWVVLGFAIGLASRAPREGAVAAAGALALSVLVYYALMYGVEGRAGARYAGAMTLMWGGLAALVGVLFGAAGAAFRHGRERLRLLAISLLGGALAGEAAFFLTRGQAGSRAAVLVAQLSIGVALPLVARPGRRRPVPALAATAVLALTALAADVAIRVAARRYGWGGY